MSAYISPKFNCVSVCVCVCRAQVHLSVYGEVCTLTTKLIRVATIDMDTTTRWSFHCNEVKLICVVYGGLCG